MTTAGISTSSPWPLGRPRLAMARSPLTAKAGLLLLMPLLGSLASAAFFAAFLHWTRTDSHFVNVAGRQRMLAAELRSWSRMVASGQDQDRDGLRSRSEAFDSALSALARGGHLLDGDLDPAPLELQDELASVAALWAALRPDLKTLTEAPYDVYEYRDTAARVDAGLGELKSRSDAVVVAFEERAQHLKALTAQVLLATTGLALVIFAAGLRLTRRYIIGPVASLGEAARRVSRGDFSQRVQVMNGDELADLAGTFNDMAGKVEGLVGAVHRQREDAERIIAAIPTGILIVDRRLRVVRTNRSFLDCCRSEEEELLGRPVVEVLGAPVLEAHLRHALDTGESRSGLLLSGRYPGRVGESRLKIAVTTTRRSEDGGEEDDALLVIVEDVTKEERLAGVARASEQRFQEVVEHATDGNVLMDE